MPKSPLSSVVIDWLLEENQPSVRYLALTELLKRPETDPGAKTARENITKISWAKNILDKQMPSGCWDNEKSLFLPIFTATFWMLLILSDLGLTKREESYLCSCASTSGVCELAIGNYGRSILMTVLMN